MAVAAGADEGIYVGAGILCRHGEDDAEAEKQQGKDTFHKAVEEEDGTEMLKSPEVWLGLQ